MRLHPHLTSLTLATLMALTSGALLGEEPAKAADKTAKPEPTKQTDLKYKPKARAKISLVNSFIWTRDGSYTFKVDKDKTGGEGTFNIFVKGQKKEFTKFVDKISDDRRQKATLIKFNDVGGAPLWVFLPDAVQGDVWFGRADDPADFTSLIRWNDNEGH